MRIRSEFILPVGFGNLRRTPAEYTAAAELMTNISQSSDDELLRSSSAGDGEAFAMLYGRWQAGIYRFAMHMSGSRTIAEEVTQDVFLTVIRDGSRFDPHRGTVSAYLFGIARNQVLRWIEREGQFVALDDQTSPVESADENVPGPLLELTQTELIATVRAAVLTLPAQYREAVVLCDLQEFSYADAALALNVPVGTVRSRLSRGRSLLFGKLKSTMERVAGTSNA